LLLFGWKIYVVHDVNRVNLWGNGKLISFLDRALNCNQWLCSRSRDVAELVRERLAINNQTQNELKIRFHSQKVFAKSTVANKSNHESSWQLTSVKLLSSSDSNLSLQS